MQNQHLPGKVYGPWILIYRNHDEVVFKGLETPEQVKLALEYLWERGHKEALARRNPYPDGVMPTTLRVRR